MATNAASAAVPPLFELVLDVGHPGGGGAASSSGSTTLEWFPSAHPPDNSDVISTSSVRAELSSEAFVSRILPFCFPAYIPPTPPTVEGSSAASGGGGGVNRYHIYLHQFICRPFVFALQLQCGQRVYGNVKPYLPPHAEARHRLDVGRRSTRALIVFTRRDGTQHSGDAFVYPNLLDSLEQLRITNKHSTNNHHHHQIQMLLDELCDKDMLSRNNNNNICFYTSSLRSMGVEHGSSVKSLLQEDVTTLASVASAPLSRTILPLLRRVGPSHFLRIMSAILCERRIVFTSADPFRLTNACQACRAILAHGKLTWHHVFVPMVPSHLLPHLAAPFPYVCGLLSKYLDFLKIPEMGTFLLVHLDKNELEVFGITAGEKTDSIFPDLLRPILVDDRYVQQASAVVTEGPTTTNSSSGATLGGVQGQHTHYQPDVTPQLYASSSSSSQTLSECLAQDLFFLLKQDQTLWAVTTGASGKAADAVVESLTKGVGGLRKLVTAVKNAKRVTAACASPDTSNNNNINNSRYPLDNNNYNNNNNLEEDDSWLLPEEQKRLSDTLDSFWDGEFAFNAKAEEELRIALSSFFVCLLGDSNTFLSASINNSTSLDRAKFMEQRKLRGDYEGTPMYVVLTHFVQSQTLEQFARERAVSSTATSASSLSLFDLTVAHLQKSKLDYSLLTVKHVVKSISQNSPYMKTIRNAQIARERTLELTSKTGYGTTNSNTNSENNNNVVSAADPVTDLAQLVEACRAIPEARLSTMAVVWTRIRDSKGMQSKHVQLALYVIKNLLLHGPLTSIADISENIHVIRLLKVYHSRLAARDVCSQIRSMAHHIYSLLIDKSLLMAQRRYCCANRKREKNKKQRLQEQLLLKRAKFSSKLKFTQVHDALRPAACSIKVMDLLDFDGNDASNKPCPALKKATSALSYGLQELLSFDSATSVSSNNNASFNNTMTDFRIASSYTSVERTSPEVSRGNPFDVFDVSSSSHDTLMLQQQHQSKMAPQQQLQQRHMNMINYNVGSYSPSLVTQHTPTTAFDPYQKQQHVQSVVPGRVPDSNNSTAPLFQQQLPAYPVMSSSGNIQSPYPMHHQQMPVPMAAAQQQQQQQQVIPVQYNVYASHQQQQQPQPYSASGSSTPAFNHPQQCRTPQQGGAAVPPYLQQPSGQQQQGQPGNVTAPHAAYRAPTGMQPTPQRSDMSWNQQQQQLSSFIIPNNNNTTQRPQQQQQQQQTKPLIQFDPFATK